MPLVTPLRWPMRKTTTQDCGIAPVNAFTALQAAIKQADEALYFCKKSGKDRVSVHTEAGFI